MVPTQIRIDIAASQSVIGCRAGNGQLVIVPIRKSFELQTKLLWHLDTLDHIRVHFCYLRWQCFGARIGVEKFRD